MLNKVLIKMKVYLFFSISTFLILSWLPNKTFSINPDTLKLTTHPQITLLSEYDDNVYLLDKQDDNFNQDVVFHLLPKFGVVRQYKKHSYGLALNSDFRKGFLSPFKSNVQTSGQINLKYNNGLQLSLRDYYMYSDFDLGLTDMPGITQRQMNNFRSKISYTFVEKLKVFGSYDNRLFTYKTETGFFERFSNVYGTGVSYNFSRRFKIEGDYKNTQEKFNEPERISNRTIDEINSKFIFPVTASFGSYLSYSFQKQNSQEIPTRNYTDNRYVYGVTWEGPNRFFIWLEGGYEEIIYELDTVNDYKNPVGELGCEIKFTEFFKGKLSAGMDVYKNIIFEGEVIYDKLDKTTVRLTANRHTQTYFLTYTPKNIYISYKYSIDIKTNLSETIQFSIGSGYQTRDDYSEDISIPSAGRIYRYSRTYMETKLKPSEKFFVIFNGSYLFQDSDSEQDNMYQYNTWVGKISIEYLINDNFNMGAHYQIATRNGTADRYDFNNNRVGLFFTYLF